MTVVAAVVCAFLARILQALPEEERTTGILSILLILFILLAYVVFSFWWRSWLAKKAGPSRFIARGPYTSWFHILGILGCIFCLASMAGGMYLITLDRGIGTIYTVAYLFWTSAAIACNYLLGVFVWDVDPKSVDLRENGVVLGAKHFIPWNYLTGFRWNGINKKLMLFTERGLTEWYVPEAARSELSAELENFIRVKEAL